ncbi:MAG: ABC transporter ATP-binding protein [Sphingopyxis sp.]|uniref:ABC transporter ATP-binding protein n=1 Tax=Sphingopyxis sp. TaxID=1908224 RepID=UPI003D80B892
MADPAALPTQRHDRATTAGAWAALRDLVGLADRWLLVAVLALMTLAALTEGVGILMLVPMLALLGDRSVASEPVTGVAAQLAGLFAGAWTLGGILLLFLALVTFRALVQHAQAVLGVRLQHRLVDTLRRRLFAGLVRAEWRWLAERRASDHIATLVVNVGRVGTAVTQLLTLAATLITACVYLAAIFLLAWQVALVAALGGFVVLAAFGGHRRRAVALGQALTHANRALQAEVGNALAGMRTTRILGGEDRQIARFDDVLGALRGQQVRYAASASHARVAMQVGGAALLAALVWIGVGWWAVPLAALLPVLLVFARLVPMLGTIQQAWHVWLHAAPAAIEANRLVAETAAHAEPVADPATPPLPFDAEIALDAVDLTHAGRDRAALAGITLRLPVRTTTAVIGASGAGKSSLADLLMGLVAPDAGTLRVDGNVIAGARRRQWRQAVAYVEQDCFLFHGSIRDNLLWAAPDADEARLGEALRMAAADFVLALPRGLDTPVGDDGVQLSGGERQRIGIARALLAKPQLLILDEATSALDPANEAAVQSAIAAMHGRLTLVVIGHRLSMLDEADQIVRLDGGRIVSAAFT